VETRDRLADEFRIFRPTCHGSNPLSHRLGRVEGSGEHPAVGAATTDIAVEPLLDLFERRIWVFVQERLARGNEAWRAIAAHQAVVAMKRRRHSRFIEAFKCLDVLALAGDCERGARINRLAVQNDCASAASTAIAPALGTSYIKPVPQRVEQRAAR